MKKKFLFIFFVLFVLAPRQLVYAGQCCPSGGFTSPTKSWYYNPISETQCERVDVNSSVTPPTFTRSNVNTICSATEKCDVSKNQCVPTPSAPSPGSTTGGATPVNCDPNTYSRWNTYPATNGNCGSTEGNPDCLNTPTECWQFITSKSGTSCVPGFRDMFSPSWSGVDLLFLQRCPYNSSTYPKTCCLIGNVGGCDISHAFNLNSPTFCQDYLTSLTSTDYKTYCTPPAHYNSSEPAGQQCTTASTNRTPAPGGIGNSLNAPGSWLGRIDTGGAISPGGGLDFFSNRLVPFLIGTALFIITVLSLFFILLAGITWTLSGGDKEALAKAKNTLTYAIVGLSVAFSVFTILKLIGTIFKVKFL